MEGYDEPPNVLRYKLQELQSRLEELSSRLTTLEGLEKRLKHLEQRQIAISKMLEEKPQH